jgi:hypothetical protein
MAGSDSDRTVLKHIEHLVGEEHTRLKEIKVELDQCWDLLRQRRALREFGDNDPDHAKVRPADVVENYEQ